MPQRRLVDYQSSTFVPMHRRQVRNRCWTNTQVVAVVSWTSYPNQFSTVLSSSLCFGQSGVYCRFVNALVEMKRSNVTDYWTRLSSFPYILSVQNNAIDALKAMWFLRRWQWWLKTKSFPFYPRNLHFFVDAVGTPLYDEMLRDFTNTVLRRIDTITLFVTTCLFIQLWKTVLNITLSRCV